MTRKRARKILMSIGTSRNHANWGLTAKPRWKTNAGVVEDTLTIKLYAKLLRARMEERRGKMVEVHWLQILHILFVGFWLGYLVRGWVKR